MRGSRPAGEAAGAAPDAATRAGSAAHTVRVVATWARIGAQQELQYRIHFWTYLLNAVVSLGVSLAGIAVVYGHTSELNGWSRDELLVVVGVFLVISGIVNGVLHTSLAAFAQEVHRGEFDFRLLKPVDAQLLALVRAIDPWRLVEVPVGLALVAWAASRLEGLSVPAATGPSADLAGYLAAPVLALLGLTALAGFWALVASLVFWSTRLEGVLWALDEMLDTVRWPLAVFPGGLRLALTFIFPAGFAVTVPAEALTGRFTPTLLVTSLAIALLFASAARVVWLRGLARYASASS